MAPDSLVTKQDSTLSPGPSLPAWPSLLCCARSSSPGRSRWQKNNATAQCLERREPRPRDQDHCLCLLARLYSHLQSDHTAALRAGSSRTPLAPAPHLGFLRLWRARPPVVTGSPWRASPLLAVWRLPLPDIPHRRKKMATASCDLVWLRSNVEVCDLSTGTPE